MSKAGFLGGVVGGGLVMVVVLLVIEVTGGFGSSTKVVTVQERPIVPTTAPVGNISLTPREVYARDAQGVVFVNATGVSAPQSTQEIFRGEGGEQGTATGSGFEIDRDGTILTNWHVVENAQNVTVGFGHGGRANAKVVGKDASHDLAVLRVPSAGLTLHPLPLGNASQMQVGDPVFAIGNPFGLGRTLTSGVVSALGRKIQAPNGLTINNALQTDAPINPGNSGGPLVNDEGQVIGINSQIETTGGGGGSVGIAFAIPIDVAKGELSMLKKDGS